MKYKLSIILIFITVLCLGEETKVIRIIDGDTFETVSGEKVRMIGINAPEISDIFGLEAKEHLENLIENKYITLIGDQLSNDKDMYQRLLRYVYLNEVDINKKMIDEGFAFAYLKYKFSKSAEYELAQLQSKENLLGIWGDKEDSNNKTERKIDENFSFRHLRAKTYVISVLLIILISIGFIYYFKK
jgi:micrococcal nuclease